MSKVTMYTISAEIQEATEPGGATGVHIELILHDPSGVEVYSIPLTADQANSILGAVAMACPPQMVVKAVQDTQQHYLAALEEMRAKYEPGHEKCATEKTKNPVNVTAEQIGVCEKHGGEL